METLRRGLLFLGLAFAVACAAPRRTPVVPESSSIALLDPIIKTKFPGVERAFVEGVPKALYTSPFTFIGSTECGRRIGQAEKMVEYARLLDLFDQEEDLPASLVSQVADAVGTEYVLLFGVGEGYAAKDYDADSLVGKGTPIDRSFDMRAALYDRKGAEVWRDARRVKISSRFWMKPEDPYAMEEPISKSTRLLFRPFFRQ